MVPKSVLSDCLAKISSLFQQHGASLRRLPETRNAPEDPAALSSVPHLAKEAIWIQGLVRGAPKQAAAIPVLTQKKRALCEVPATIPPVKFPSVQSTSASLLHQQMV